MATNLYKLYYKDYFTGMNFIPVLNDNVPTGGNLAAYNKTLTNGGLLVNDEGCEYINTRFEMKVLYPGLVTGIGITHTTGAADEFKLGINLDYTSGMPVIYGSSVKGTLRSYFDQVYDGENSALAINEIFENSDGPATKPLYDRDIFFNAVIKSPCPDGRILASDSITPHNRGKFLDPVPISFLKIAPGCTIEFRFHLVDSHSIQGLTAEKKKELFMNILGTFGIGAKSNVGYGQLEPVTVK